MTATKKTKPFFFVKDKHLLKRIETSGIKYIVAEGNFCYLKTDSETPLSIKISLKKLLSYFNKDHFIRVHKSYVVNLNLIKEVNIKDRTLLIDSEYIPIGRTYYSALSEQLSLF